MDVLALWSGRIRLTPGRLSFVGELGSTHAHAHAAVQLLLVSDGLVELTDENGVKRQVRAALIPTGVTHTMHAEAASGACVYFDPASRHAQVLICRGSTIRRDVAGWSAPVAEIVRQLPMGPMDPDVVETMITSLTGSNEPQPHPAVKRAVELLDTPSVGPVRLGDISRMVGMSSSRLRHLFSDQLGLPFSAYVRWARLRTAMHTVKDGGTLTQAAHAAGFADSAHLTRVTHAMFGLAPSHLAQGLSWA